ncbi:UDP-xylose and UDP-N-acetylglucosamine transporter-like isoform X1 [Limulus polyphemus]|uniref:UDP-xylose and UDP-N-acetylglucosamine transporter-like isoform X1 n=1 Tax=Limulus polyphemus TaxID=6850 RepID=A0ABM1TIK8_LIMPO|nr:UDP-xylose and UDP-N-acetylglucosamine transporter-like isoform X1 [Limulus polyphemus]XP_022255715.1 UDP-xylose and UDP-N-acetylglucosamine transporter-like isoform X1 [Limulus polyphemus]
MISVIPLILVYFGCCSNVVFLELLTSEAPGSGNIITFAQFLVIAVEGFIFSTKFGRKKAVIPLSYYASLVVMFFLVSVANNYALNFNISMPLHMIFRSGSLIANMILGMIILKRSYKLKKFIAVGMITIGISICTVASRRDVQSSQVNVSEESTFEDLQFWLIGLFLLTFALFASAYMGIYQEILYKKFGKQPREALFYSHALPLPGFLLLAKNIYTHAVIFSNSEPVQVPIAGGIPKLWLYLLGNVITQYVCIRSVYWMTTELSSLSVTLIVTLRKFLSLLLSIFYFQNPFTFVHWTGTILVFGGTLVFVDLADVWKEYKSKQQKSD